MLRSLSSGISGMRNHQTRMDVIADNIANVNTVSFKYSRVIFKDVLSQSIRGSSASGVGAGSVNPSQVGMGMTVGSIDRVFTQGISDPTSRSTDLTISGNGFFVVADHLGDSPKDGDIKADDLYLTRDGAFYINDDGYLVNSLGQYVMGIRTSDVGGDKTVVPINLKDIDFDETFENEYIESVSFGRDGMINVNGRTVFDDKYKLYVGVFQHENPEALVRYGNNLYECPVEDASRIMDADKPSVAARTTFQVTAVPEHGAILNIGGYKIGFSHSDDIDEPIEGVDFTINVNGMEPNATDFSKLAAIIRGLPIDDVVVGGEGNSITVSAAKTGVSGNEIGVLADPFSIPTGAKLEGGEDGKQAELTFKVTHVPEDDTILTIAGYKIGFFNSEVGDYGGDAVDKTIDTKDLTASGIAEAIKTEIKNAIDSAGDDDIIKGIEISASGTSLTLKAEEAGYTGNAIFIEATDYSAYNVTGQT
ncbi:MAG TPA: flagellar hook-basal body complex protein, partial [Clostridia bacterium]|nr:flagellar hook-basal body complex protein [Clostridia bacterium]